MKAPYNYFIDGEAPVEGDITVTATFSSAPVSPTVQFTDYLHDKQVGLMLMHDDGSIWDLAIADMIKNFSYPDGAGTQRQIGYGIGVTGNVRDGSNPEYTSWTQYAAILAADSNLALMNHSYSHTNLPTPTEQLVLNEAAVRDNLGIEMNTIIPPSGLPGFVQAGFDLLNYRMVISQGYYNPDGPYADGYNDEVSYVDGSAFEDIITNRMMITTRFNMDGFLVPGQADLRSWLAGKVSGALTDNEKRIFAAFSHSPYTQDEMDYLEEFVNYALSLNGGDMWMPNPQQYCDYQDVRQNADIINLTTVGNSITFGIDFSGLHARTRYKDLTLKFGGGTLTSVVVSNAQGHSVNYGTNLLNIYMSPAYVPPAVTDIDDVLNPLVDHRYTATHTKNGSGTAALNGENAVTIIDSISTRDLSYGGDSNPLFGRKPQLFKQFGILDNIGSTPRSLDMVFMDNQIGIQFDAGSPRVKGYPRAKGRVWFQPDYFLYEAWDNNTFRPYLGELLRDTIRVTTGEAPNEYQDVNLPINRVNYVYQEFYDDGVSEAGRVTTKLWLNGVLLDPLIHHNTYNRVSVTEGFGADSNCAMHGFIENFDIYGRVLTTEQREDVWEAIQAYYKVDQELDLPIASNVDFQNVAGTVTATCTYSSPDGHIEDVGGRECWWVSYAPGGGIQSGEVVPELNNVFTFNRADFPTKFNGGCRVNIRVKDSVTGFKNYIPGVRYKGSL